MSDMGHVNPHLMGAARFQRAFHQGGSVEHFLDRIMGHRRLAPIIPDNRHFLAINITPADAALDCSRSRIGPAVDDGHIAPFDIMFGEQGAQTLVCRVGLGRDHQSGRILVDSVDDPGSGYAANARQLAPTMVQKGVDESPVGMTGRRMDDQARRLVDYDQVRVFEDHVERDILRRPKSATLPARGKARRPLLSKPHRDAVSFENPAKFRIL